MANIKISDMTRTTSVGGSDLLPIVQGGQSKSIEYKNINKYSTSEQVVGTWINGKPLYQLTLEVTTIPQVTTDGTASSYSTPLDTNIDFAFIENAQAIAGSGAITNIQPMPYINNAGRQFKMQITPTANSFPLNFQIVSNGTAFNAYYKVIATIKYTKSTDSAS